MAKIGELNSDYIKYNQPRLTSNQSPELLTSWEWSFLIVLLLLFLILLPNFYHFF